MTTLYYLTGIVIWFLWQQKVQNLYLIKLEFGVWEVVCNKWRLGAILHDAAVLCELSHSWYWKMWFHFTFLKTKIYKIYKGEMHPNQYWVCFGVRYSLNSRDLFLNLRRLVKMTKPLRFENKSLRLKYKCLICILIMFWAILDLFINPKYLFQNKSFSQTYYFKSEKSFVLLTSLLGLKINPGNLESISKLLTLIWKWDKHPGANCLINSNIALKFK